MVSSEVFLIPDDWEYRGEGNCHLVLGFPKLKKVLRIRKRVRPTNIFQWIIHFIQNYIFWWYDNAAKAEELDLNFYLNVMRPLLGPRCVSEAKQVKLCSIQVKRIEKQLNKIRPDFRKHKYLHHDRATLFQDFTSLDLDDCTYKLSKDTYTVEIKPKKGWIAFSERTFPECIFCMNQYIKLETQKISQRSSYCPQQLFSGKEDKMRESISKLLDNPQNNIRIFHNGSIIYSDLYGKNDLEDIVCRIFEHSCHDRKKLLDDFVYLLFKCLTKQVIFKDNCETRKFCQSDPEILPKGCILERILSAQMLDTKGTAFYNKCLQQKIFSDWGYVKKLLNNLDEKMCIKCNICELSTTSNQRCDELIAVPYLIAAVANDCSLMITLNKIHDENMQNIDENQVIGSMFGTFLWNIGIVDLYPKPMSTIKKHELRNKKLLKSYIASTTKSN